MSGADAGELKTCKICGQTLPLEDFVKSTSAKSGRGARCKSCDNERHKALRAGTAEPLPKPEPDPEPPEVVEELDTDVPKPKVDRATLIASLLEERNHLLESAQAEGLRVMPYEIDRSLKALGWWPS